MENQYSLTGLSPHGDNSPKTNWEDIYSKRLVDSASRHVTEGRFEQARLQLEAAQRLCAGTKGLAELLAISEVCLAAVGRSCPCQSRRHKFPDWYHILKVDENADTNLIKKRYRQLALLLHPDKNTHVQAEGAFKYISQAYDCLSDKNKRITFNLERAKLFCRRCSAWKESRQYIPTVADTVSTRFPQNQPVFVSPRGSCTGVWSPTECVTESVGLQTFRRKARARAEAAGSELGSRVWRWNKEFEKLNIRREETNYGRRHILSTARRRGNQARGAYMLGNKGSRPGRYTKDYMSELRYDDTRQDDFRTMPGNGTGMQTEKPRVSTSLDDLLKSVKSEAGKGRIVNSYTRESAYPGFEKIYFGSGYRQSLPTTAEIIKYFKDLPARSHEPEPAEDPKKLNTEISLKEVYFPSKKVVDSSTVQQTQEQSGSISQPVVLSTRRVNFLPEKDLSLLDSSSLLRNLDAALADITRSAGKSDYSNSTSSQSKRDRRSLQMDSSSEYDSFLSKFSVHEKPPRKLGSDVRTEELKTSNDEVNSLQNDKNGCRVAENPSMLITPLLRKQGEMHKIPDVGRSVLETHRNGSYGSYLAKRRNFVSMSQSPALSSSIHSSEAGNCEMAFQTKLTEKFETSHPASADNSCCPLRTEATKTSGLNPLLSSEKLGRWMDNIPRSSKVTCRGTHLDTSSSGREENENHWPATGTWWENKDEIPSYLSAKGVRTFLPDFRRIWTQTDDDSNPSKKAPIVTTSTTKSDFSCNPTRSLASSTRTATSDFSCSPAISLASSTRMTSSNLVCNSANSPASINRMTSSNFSCSPQISLSSSTRHLGSENYPPFCGLRFLQTRRSENLASCPTSKILDSAASEISHRSSLAQMPPSAMNAGKEFVYNHIGNGTLSNQFSWLSHRDSQKVPVSIESSEFELDQHYQKSAHLHGVNNLEYNSLKSDELVATLGRLREEAKSIAATLETYNETSRIKKAKKQLPEVCSSNTNGVLPKCLSASPGLIA